MPDMNEIPVGDEQEPTLGDLIQRQIVNERKMAEREAVSYTLRVLWHLLGSAGLMVVLTALDLHHMAKTTQLILDGRGFAPEWTAEQVKRSTGL